MIGAVGGDLPKFHIGRQRRVDQGARTYRAARVDNNADALELLSRRPVRVVNLEWKSPFDRLDKIGVGAIQSTGRAQIKNFHRSHFLGSLECVRDRGRRE